MENDARKALYKKYKMVINIKNHGVDTTLISTGFIMAGVGMTVPIMLSKEIMAIVCGTMGLSDKLMRRKLMSKAQKHYEIKTLADSKLNYFKIIIPKALNDGQIIGTGIYNGSW